MKLVKLYELLLDEYGPQGWWPLICSSKWSSENGYHRSDYTYPHNEEQIYEIILGAILTQNTNWNNASKSINILYKSDLINPEKLLSLTEMELAEKIRSSGYYNLKSRKILKLTKVFLDSGYLGKKNINPSRDILLGCWGIGPETADSILLFAFKELSFVIDLYTRRILSRLGYGELDSPYQWWKDLCTELLPAELTIYQEFHALMLAHAKAVCGTKPKCLNCFIKKYCGSCKYPD